MSVHQFRLKNEEVAPQDEPPRLSDRAMDNLRFIRETMERSTAFTAVPGYGGALMGATAIGAAVIASQQTSVKYWLYTWLAEAVLAFAIGFFAMWQKAKSADTSLVSAPARKFAFGFAPPLFVGIVLTLLMYRIERFDLLPSIWLLLYGAAVTTGGMFSVKPVPLMGIGFLLLGTIATFTPVYLDSWLMAAGFGVLHIIFGFIIGKNYGG
jgi:hypothetical protein